MTKEQCVRRTTVMDFENDSKCFYKMSDVRAVDTSSLLIKPRDSRLLSI